MTGPTHLYDRIDATFAWYGVHTAENQQRMSEVRQACAMLCKKFADNCPEGRELSLALTKIEEAGMFAVASIARQGGVGYPDQVNGEVRG